MIELLMLSEYLTDNYKKELYEFCKYVYVLMGVCVCVCVLMGVCVFEIYYVHV